MEPMQTTPKLLVGTINILTQAPTMINVAPVIKVSLRPYLFCIYMTTKFAGMKMITKKIICASTRSIEVSYIVATKSATGLKPTIINPVVARERVNENCTSHL